MYIRAKVAGYLFEYPLLLVFSNLVPTQAFLRQRSNISRINTALAKCFDKGYSVTQVVIRNNIDVRRDYSSEIIAKCNVYRRAIIKCADAHRQNMLRRLSGFVGQSMNKIRM